MLLPLPPRAFGNTELTEFTILPSLTCQHCYHNLSAIKEVLLIAVVWVQSIITAYFVIWRMGIKGWATKVFSNKKMCLKLLRIHIRTSLTTLIFIAGCIGSCETQIRYWSNTCVSPMKWPERGLFIALKSIIKLILLLILFVSSGAGSFLSFSFVIFDWECMWW